jgi:hypothetical protein
MSPKKSSEPEDPPLLREPELELDLELELELDELRELEPLDREPPLNDWPPPGRASKKVTLGRGAAACATAAVWLRTAAWTGLPIKSAVDRAPARKVVWRCRRE